jgi:hypothetical protein
MDQISMKFEKIENSAFLPFYTNELWAISRSIVSLGKQLYNTKLYLNYIKDKNIRELSPTSETHEIISLILSLTSRLDKLLRASSRRENEDDEAYQFRKDRCDFLRNNFLPKKKKTHEIFKSNIRNAIEHFDERLDLMCNQIISQNQSINTKTLFCNQTITNINIFNDRWEYILPFKVFVINTGEYFMTDKDFEKQSILIYTILDEAHKLEQKCYEWSASGRDINGNFAENPSGQLKIPPHQVD